MFFFFSKTLSEDTASIFNFSPSIFQLYFYIPLIDIIKISAAKSDKMKLSYKEYSKQ